MTGIRRLLCTGLLSCALGAAQAVEPFRVDLHAHLTMDRAANPVFRGEPGHGSLAGHGWNFWTNQVDAESLHQAGIQIVVVALWPPFAIRPGRSAFDESLDQLRQLQAFVRAEPGFAIGGSAEELRVIAANGRIALLPMIEGGEGIGSIEDLDALYAAGARGLTLVHFADSALGGAARMPNLRMWGIAPDISTWRGLSPFGALVIERMLSLGMVLDLAHASTDTADAALRLTGAAGVPVLLSHVHPWELDPEEANVPVALAQRVAAGGGMIGVSAQQHWVQALPEDALIARHVRGSCDDVAADWLFFARRLPAEQVALGSDFNGFIWRAGPGGRCPQGLVNAHGLPALFAAVASEMGSDTAVDRSGEVFLRLFERVEASADQKARAEAATRVRTVARSLDAAF